MGKASKDSKAENGINRQNIFQFISHLSSLKPSPGRPRRQ
jgi:5-methylcytosine-specific restriction endonuclease McrBC regulatory subunit McrC